ncbi:MAG: protein kinase [Acidobacteriota bacterium]
MSLLNGTRLGPYEIVAPLGAGGMGEVYRAHDARLGRDVALKVISPDLAHDPDRVARFEREARAASALTDAHIVAVFDVGEQNGIHYFASELVEGPSLHQLLLDGPLPTRKALEFAAQIAQALAAAHEKGIVHRDLKPANVLVAPPGIAKIADFGLAKAIAGSLGDSAAQTESGILIGTVTYMSPEQAAGKRVDGRSDQFALGAMLVEMLTGQAPFRRSTGAETLTAILRHDPDLTALAGLDLPDSVIWILERCLCKDPEGRYASTKDLARELHHLRDGTTRLRGPRTSTTQASRQGLGRSIGALLLGISCGALAMMLVRHPSAAPREARPLRFLVPPPAEHSFVNTFESVGFAVSPDGTTLAFVAANGSAGPSTVWLRTLDDAEARLLPGSENARSLFWSPDGKSLGFFNGSGLSMIALAGSGVVKICDVPPGSGVAATWGSNGSIAYTLTAGDAIYRVSALGGTPTVWHAREVANGELRMGWPQYLADGGLLYTVRGPEGSNRLRLLSGENATRDLGPISSRFELLDQSTIVQVRDRALVEQHFDRVKGLIGAPAPIAPFVRAFRSTLWSGFAGSRGGTLLWQAAVNVNELAWFDRFGVRGETLGTRGDILAANVSPDGLKVISTRTRPELGTYDVWSFDLDRGIESPLTTDPDTEFGGLLTRDAKTLFYSAVRANQPAIIERDLASGAERSPIALGGFQVAQAISQDGHTLLFARRAETGFELWTLALDGRSSPQPIVRGGDTEYASLSPDGNYLAFIATDSGGRQAYVARLAAPAERVALSSHGARSIVWPPDSSEILYLSDRQEVISIPVRTSPRLEIGRPETLFTVSANAPWAGMSASPDGRKLLANLRLSSASEQPLVALVGHVPPR